MKLSKKLLTMAALAAIAFTPSAFADVTTGEAAPDFEAVTASGEAFKLSDHAGKTVVLEWTNKGCPFVVKHYESGNMQKVQQDALAMGDVAWVTIISSAPGKQGHMSGEEALAHAEEQGANHSVLLIDESGEVGKLYGAQTTPHMYVIDADGTLVYQGAIDSDSSADPATIEGAENYVLAALESVKAGEPVETAQTQPYGCAVKY